jgi:hypothetical protein
VAVIRLSVRRFVVTATLGLAIVPAAAANVPATQTFKPAKLGISFALPSDWAGSATGLRFEAVGPGRVAQLDIAAAATTLPFSFEHGDMFFIVAYSTTSDWTAKEKPIFCASIRSFRFANVA